MSAAVAWQRAAMLEIDPDSRRTLHKFARERILRDVLVSPASDQQVAQAFATLNDTLPHVYQEALQKAVAVNRSDTRTRMVEHAQSLWRDRLGALEGVSKRDLELELDKRAREAALKEVCSIYGARLVVGSGFESLDSASQKTVRDKLDACAAEKRAELEKEDPQVLWSMCASEDMRRARDNCLAFARETRLQRLISDETAQQWKDDVRSTQRKAANDTTLQGKLDIVREAEAGLKYLQDVQRALEQPAQYNSDVYPKLDTLAIERLIKAVKQHPLYLENGIPGIPDTDKYSKEFNTLLLKRRDDVDKLKRERRGRTLVEFKSNLDRQNRETKQAFKAAESAFRKSQTRPLPSIEQQRKPFVRETNSLNAESKVNQYRAEETLEILKNRIGTKSAKINDLTRNDVVVAAQTKRILTGVENAMQRAEAIYKLVEEDEQKHPENFEYDKAVEKQMDLEVTQALETAAEAVSSAAMAKNALEMEKQRERFMLQRRLAFERQQEEQNRRMEAEQKRRKAEREAERRREQAEREAKAKREAEAALQAQLEAEREEAARKAAEAARLRGLANSSRAEQNPNKTSIMKAVQTMFGASKFDQQQGSNTFSTVQTRKQIFDIVGLVPYETGGGGDCFFHALRAVLLHNGLSCPSTSILRAELCNYLFENMKTSFWIHGENQPTSFLAFTGMTEKNYKQKFNVDMRTSGTWVDHTVFYYATALKFRQPFVVFQSNGSQVRKTCISVPCTDENENEPRSMLPLCLYQYDKVHFQALMSYDSMNEYGIFHSTLGERTRLRLWWRNVVNNVKKYDAYFNGQTLVVFYNSERSVFNEANNTITPSPDIIPSRSPEATEDLLQEYKIYLEDVLKVSASDAELLVKLRRNELRIRVENAKKLTPKRTKEIEAGIRKQYQEIDTKKGVKKLLQQVKAKAAEEAEADAKAATDAKAAEEAEADAKAAADAKAKAEAEAKAKAEADAKARAEAEAKLKAAKLKAKAAEAKAAEEAAEAEARVEAIKKAREADEKKQAFLSNQTANGSTVATGLTRAQRAALARKARKERAAKEQQEERKEQLKNQFKQYFKKNYPNCMQKLKEKLKTPDEVTTKIFKLYKQEITYQAKKNKGNMTRFEFKKTNTDHQQQLQELEDDIRAPQAASAASLGSSAPADVAVMQFATSDAPPLLVIPSRSI